MRQFFSGIFSGSHPRPGKAIANIHFEKRYPTYKMNFKSSIQQIDRTMLYFCTSL